VLQVAVVTGLVGKGFGRGLIESEIGHIRLTRTLDAVEG
jgi:hypothetical protein